jgi:molybdopterin-guanine dinucleotide biosynthesis protein A
MNFGAVIFAGGNSSHKGRDNEFLEIDQATLLTIQSLFCKLEYSGSR